MDLFPAITFGIAVGACFELWRQKVRVDKLTNRLNALERNVRDRFATDQSMSERSAEDAAAQALGGDGRAGE